MTSKPLSSSSKKQLPQPKVTYKMLLRDSVLWEQVKAVFRSVGWADLKVLMEAERQMHLEAVVSAESTEDRDRHIYIVQWLMDMFDAEGREAELRSEQQALSAKESDDYSTGSDWMAPDSGGGIDPEGHLS